MLSSLNRDKREDVDKGDGSKPKSRRNKARRKEKKLAEVSKSEQREKLEVTQPLVASDKKRRRSRRRSARDAAENVPLLTSFDFSYSIQKEDVEAQHVRLNVNESLSFAQALESYVKEVGNAFLSTTNTKSANYDECYMESATTGRFKRFRSKLGKDGLKAVKKKHTSNEYNPEGLRNTIQHVNQLLSSFFLLCSGILTGASMFEVIVVFQVTQEKLLLEIYGPIALEIRRISYFLSVLAVVGACDKFNVKCSYSLIVLFYGLCLLFTLLSSPFSDEMGNTYAASQGDQTDWIEIIQTSTTFNLQTWKNLILCRFICSLIGWMLLSKIIKTL